MLFFKPPFIRDEIEKQYKELVKVLHPDKGGTNELMQQLNKEKNEALKLCGAEKKVKRIKMIKRVYPIKKTKTVNFNINAGEAIEFIKQLKKIIK